MPLHELYDKSKRIYYQQERLLGKGSFANCYSIKNIQTGETTACKTISKSKLRTEKEKKQVLVLVFFNCP